MQQQSYLLIGSPVDFSRHPCQVPYIACMIQAPSKSFPLINATRDVIGIEKHSKILYNMIFLLCDGLEGINVNHNMCIHTNDYRSK